MKSITPRPFEWIDEAPVQVSRAREMAATPEQVFDVIADHEGWADWFDGVDRVEVTGGAAGIGGARRVTVKGLGVLEEQFNAWEPGRAFGFTVVAMSRPSLRSLNELVRIEPSGSGVRVTYQQGYDPTWWASPLIRLAATRAIPKALDAALAELETRALAE